MRVGEYAQLMKNSRRGVAATHAVEAGAATRRMADNMIQRGDPEDDSGVSIITSTPNSELPAVRQQESLLGNWLIRVEACFITPCILPIL